MTYSIVARDPGTGALGVGVQSHYFDVGPVVPWAEAGVGAVATQSVVEVGYGPRGLALMREGVAAPDALAQLVGADELEFVRQVAMVDAEGAVGVHTGAACVGAAGHAVGDGVSVQANMMVRETVWDAMLAAYAAAEGDLAARILAALDAAQAEGGDARGQQSAALLVVDGERSDTPWSHVLFDLRVDDDPEPLVELRRLVDYARAFRLVTGVFESGLLFAPVIDESMKAALEDALADLDAAQAVVGDNREPTFWQGVLLAKAGRVEEARARIRHARETNAEWRSFLRRLPASGLLPDDEALVGRLVD
ncbi:MAG TPA: DUF1028 domain-containing protein [Acidimicrobiia bacterium]|nr:DUF1028 domain-containing protein [Acidimicrobiia bacterium]